MPEGSSPPEWDAARYEREKRGFIERRRLRQPVTLHAALIFAFTVAAGWGCSFVLLAAGMRSMPLRYGLSFLAAYPVFLLCVRVWADAMRRDEPARGDWGWDAPAVDGEGCAVMLVALLAGTVLAGFFGLFGGAQLLLEVAFEVVFAGVVVRRLRGRETVGDWSGRLLRGTWFPALVIGLVLLSAAGWLQHQAPGAHTLAEAIRQLRHGR